MTSLEDVLAFSQIRQYLTPEQETSIAQAMGTNIAEINRRMVGKDKEDEFILILLFMDICKTVSGFDEGVSKLFHASTSDLIIELKNGKKFLLEIKHTGEGKYHISAGNLAKRVAYAKSLGLDLYFAISLKGFWMFFKSDYLDSHGGTIVIEDYINSELDEILGTFSYMFPNGLKIRSVYMKHHKKPVGIQHDEYGELVSYKFYYKEKELFRVKGVNSQFLGYSMILEALQDRMSAVRQDINKDRDATVVIEEFPMNSKSLNIISEYEFLLSPVRHTVNEKGENFTERTAVASLKSDKKVLTFQKEHIRGMMKTLVEKGVPIKLVHKGYITEL